jgi:hypothetical protein
MKVTKKILTLTNEEKSVLLTAATLLDAIAESAESFASLNWSDFTTDEMQCAASLLTSLADSSVTED